jgi:opacity protein-like surface antigen
MKVHFIILVALVTLAIPALCAATPPRPGPYMSGFVGVSVPQNADVTSYDYVADKSYSDRVEFDPGINIGGTAGYDYGFLRLEGELSYKHGEIATITDQINGQRFHNADGNLGALAVMFNGFFDLHNDSPVTPYVGGGIGFAAMHLSDTFVSEYGPPIYQQDDDSVFAYQAGAGLEIAFNQRLSLDLGYRYFATSKAKFGSDRDITTELKFQSHNVAIGLRVKY